ncbi:MAG: Fpg/Nei family DNA glycosylase [Actinomycetaceae bacterium]|nr:Fpg/Nei family DNA glycosylase [Actinomycetaceae bacterium]
MPEGHSIHRLAATLNELFTGTALRTSSPQGRFSDGARLLDGQVMLPAQAWGKHLFVPFVPRNLAHELSEYDAAEVGALGSPVPTWLQVHLGLYGAWTFQGDETFAKSTSVGAPRRKIGEGDDVVGVDYVPGAGYEPGADTVWEPPAPRDTVRLRIETEHGVGDLTGPNQCRIIDALELERVLNRLGPDPIRNDPGDRAEFIARVRGRRMAVGALVMDQSVAAGPGNIYRAECLFRTGIHPYRPGARVSEKRVGELWDDLVLTMRDGVKTGKIWTLPEELAPAEEIAGDPEASRWAVYQRTGRTCLRCGSTVKEAEMQGRRLFWCGGCQR